MRADGFRTRLVTPLSAVQAREDSGATRLRRYVLTHDALTVMPKPSRDILRAMVLEHRARKRTRIASATPVRASAMIDTTPSRESMWAEIYCEIDQVSMRPCDVSGCVALQFRRFPPQDVNAQIAAKAIAPPAGSAQSERAMAQFRIDGADVCGTRHHRWVCVDPVHEYGRAGSMRRHCDSRGAQRELGRRCGLSWPAASSTRKASGHRDCARACVRRGR